MNRRVKKQDEYHVGDNLPGEKDYRRAEIFLLALFVVTVVVLVYLVTTP